MKTHSTVYLLRSIIAHFLMIFHFPHFSADSPIIHIMAMMVSGGEQHIQTDCSQKRRAQHRPGNQLFNSKKPAVDNSKKCR